MHEKEFRENIYRYCDNNIGKEILFKGFEWLWPQNHDISPKNLATLTSKIVNNLVRDRTLEEIPKPLNSDVPYGMYKILPHKKLINK